MARGKSQPTDYALSYGGHRLPVVAVLTREYWLFGPVGVSNRTARPVFDEYISVAWLKRTEQASGVLGRHRGCAFKARLEGCSTG